ncbi:beta strand repeat-containing protein, partial [Bartonella raoultii]|uniref:beta strand repeat-containing protein n=1 Tax=Bartonella raoultii TaxID=1457020 RepID=UPI001ABBCEA3
MYKKSLLSSIATAAIVLFNIQFNVHAESLEVSGEKKEVKGATYETLHALKEGQIIGTDLKVTGNKDTNSSSNTNIFVVTTEGKGSAIKLTGDKTTIKGTDSDIRFGLAAGNDAILQMTGGTITVSDTGVHFLNTNSTENKLENVTISSGKDDAPLLFGIKTENSTITLENVKVTQTNNAVVANNNSTITISGGSFETQMVTLSALNGSTLTLNNNVQITSENAGLYAKNGGAISMMGGTIKASEVGAGFEGSNNEKNKLENVTISSNKEDALLKKGVSADNSTVALTNVTVSQAVNAVVADNNSTITISGGSFETKKVTLGALNGSTITLNNNVQITSENSGLYAKDGGAISMTGGTIKASEVGAGFEGSNNEKNKLENVTISSNKEDALLKEGIYANKSTVSLKNVTVSQAINAVVADSNSTITISGGSFDAKLATITAKNNDTIILTDDAQITSSEDTGLLAKDGGAISMTGGTIKAFYNGASFEGSNSEKNKLENVTILSNKDGALLNAGVSADKSTVSLKNVTVTQAKSAVVADNESKITVSGGSFDAKNATIVALNNGTIILTDDAQITSSENTSLLAKDGGAISMTGGTIKAFYSGASFENSKREENKLENVTISNVKDDAQLRAGVSADKSTVALKNVTVSQAANAVVADNESTITVSGGSLEAKYTTIITQNNSTIILTDNAQITSSEDDGLLAQEDGAISMTGGTIKAVYSGASFENSKREENKLENVTISSVKDGDDALLHYGIEANKSTIILNNVTVTKAETAIIADDHSIITVSGGSFESNDDGIYAKQGSSISLNNATVTSSYGDSVYADGQDSKIIMVGGSATAKRGSAALLTENEGQIDATDVTLTTDGIGTGALALGESTIQLHGNTTINNTLNGLRAIDGGKITGENLNITGGKAITDPDTERYGVSAEGAGSEINLTGKTIIQNVDEGLYADGGSKITSGDLTIIGDESEKITTAVGSYEPESKIELNGNTTIKSFDLGLAAVNRSSIIMKNGAKNEIDVKKVALAAMASGQIDLANTDVKAESIGMQLVALSKTNTDEDELQIDGDNEINLTNSNIHVDNGTGILVGAFVKKSIENNIAPSIGKVNLNNSEIHADVLLGNDVFWDKISLQEENVWNDENMKEISTGSFTLNADHSILEGRANIAQERNVHFDL